MRKQDKFISIRLSSKLDDEIESAAAFLGVGKSKFMKDCVEKELRKHNASSLDTTKANLEFLEEGKQRIFEMFEEVRDKFDGSEYQQGKKDGLRIALAILGYVGMAEFNRGGSQAREGNNADNLEISG